MKNIIKNLIISVLITTLYIIVFNKINQFTFVILGIVTFFASYILISKLNTIKIKKHKAFPALFIILYSIITLIPLLSISNETRSNIEKRFLTKYKPLIINKNLNIGYAKDLNQYFSDRFLFRKFLIYKNLQIKYLLADKYFITRAGLINKDTMWGFERGYVSSLATEQPYLTLKIFQNKIKPKNCKLYFLISPKKNILYPEEVEIYKKYFLKQSDIIQNNMKKLIKHKDINIIDVLEDLKQAKSNDYVFYKTDSHFTDYGAYTLYLALSKRLKKDFPQYNIVTLKDFNISYNKLQRYDFHRKYLIGSLMDTLPYDRKYIKNNLLKTEYKYYDYKYSDKTIKHFDFKKGFKSYKTPSNKKLKLMIIGTSLNENLLGFLPYSVSDLEYYLLNEGYAADKNNKFKIYKRFHKQIEQFKPDIIVISINSTDFLQEMINFIAD